MIVGNESSSHSLLPVIFHVGQIEYRLLNVIREGLFERAEKHLTDKCYGETTFRVHLVSKSNGQRQM